MESTKEINPYINSSDGKKEQVAQMFDNIAPKYDFLNHFLSMHIDKIWRRKAIKILKKSEPQKILDIATGTGDFAIEINRMLKPELIIGIDISKGMLEKGIEKINKRKLDKVIQFQEGDSENIDFPNNSFDAVTVAFGVRNFENLEKGLNEMFRVLKTGGELIILEFSTPQKFPGKQFYSFYLKRVLPFIGRFFSKDNRAYSYLPESVKAFPFGGEFVSKLKDSGFRNCFFRKLSLGISTIYYGKK